MKCQRGTMDALSFSASAIRITRLFLFRGVALCCLGIGLSLTSCSREKEEMEADTLTPDSETVAESTEEITDAAASDGKLRPVDEEEYQNVLSEHRGEIIVVDFWATWCPPCVESFPKLVAFHSEYKDKGVTVIGASVDFPGTETEVEEFIKEHNAEFQNLFVEAGNMDSFISSVSPNWGGGIPAVFVYDRDGEPAAQYLGSSAVEEAKNKVDALLN